MCKKVIAFLAFINLVHQTGTLGQTWTAGGCDPGLPQVLSVMIDACNPSLAPSDEGLNEYFIFQTGDADFDVNASGISLEYGTDPNNLPQSPAAENSVTAYSGNASYTAMLNAGAGGCTSNLGGPIFIDAMGPPTNGLIPAGSIVWAFNASSPTQPFDPGSFAYLCGAYPIYVIYGNSANVSGMMRNATCSICPRYLDITFGGCEYSITYNPGSLINANGVTMGTPQEREGSFIELNSGGSISYGNDNNACAPPALFCAPPDPPVINNSPNPAELCNGDPLPTITCSVCDASTMWFDDVAATVPIATGTSYTPTQAGTYWAANPGDDCQSDRVSFELIVNDLPDADFSAAETQLCPGDDLELSVTNPVDGGCGASPCYTWTVTGGNGYNTSLSAYPPSLSLQLPDEGSYTVTLTIFNGNTGCGSELTLNDYVTVAAPQPDILVPAAICIGDDLSLDGSGSTGTDSGTSFNWTLLNTTSGMVYNAVGETTVASGLDPGVYDVTLTIETSMGCTAALTENAVVDVTDAPVVELLPQGVIFDCYTQIANLNALVVEGAGGEWSGGAYVQPNGDFDPSGLAVGSYPVTYTLGSPPCSSTANADIVIQASPQLQLTESAITVCMGSPAIDLAAYEAGGSDPGNWSGDGVAGTTFDPSGLPAGTYDLTFYLACIDSSIIDLTSFCPTAYVPVCACNGVEYGNDCIATNFGGVLDFAEGPCLTALPDECANPQLTLSITIEEVADVIVAPVTDIICSDELPLDLGGYVDPSSDAGTWGGSPDISGNSFDPAVSGSQTFTLVFSSSNTNCPDEATLTLTVNESTPAILTETSISICTADLPLDLDGFVDAGSASGTWDGLGVTGTTFDPAVSGTESFTLLFETGTNSCNGSANLEITVSEQLEVVLAQTSYEGCDEQDPIDLDQFIDPSSSAGAWSGPGVTGSEFDPTAVSGTQTLTYTAGTGDCGDSEVFEITVNQPVTPELNATDFVVCTTGLPLDLEAFEVVPGAGVWGGDPAVSGSSFAPDVSATTQFDLTYEGQGSSCLGTTPFQVTVVPQPEAELNPMPYPLCNETGDGSNPLSFDLDDLIVGGTGGTWVTQPEILPSPIDAGNVFNAAGLPAGGYVVVYTLAADAPCAEVAIAQSLEVVDCLDCSADPGFGTPPNFCAADGSPFNLNDLLTGDAGGAWTTNAVGALANDSLFTPSGLEGDYEITYTILGANGCPDTLHTETLTVVALPDASTVAPAGPLCNVGSGIFDLDLLISGDGGGAWSSPDAPPGVVNGGGSFNPSGLDAGDYTVVYSLPTTPPCDVFDAQSQQTITVLAPDTTYLPTATSCTLEAEIDVSATAATPGSWSLLPSPDGFASLDNPSSPVVNVTASETGTYGLVWTGDNADPCLNSVAISISFGSLEAFAGLDDTVCGYQYGLEAQTLVGGATGVWRYLCDPAADVYAYFDDEANPQATVTVTEYGWHEFEWSVEQGGCTAADTVRVLFLEHTHGDLTFTSHTDVEVDCWEDDSACGSSYPLPPLAPPTSGTSETVVVNEAVGYAATPGNITGCHTDGVVISEVPADGYGNLTIDSLANYECTTDTIWEMTEVITGGFWNYQPADSATAADTTLEVRFYPDATTYQADSFKVFSVDPLTGEDTAAFGLFEFWWENITEEQEVPHVYYDCCMDDECCQTLAADLVITLSGNVCEPFTVDFLQPLDVVYASGCLLGGLEYEVSFSISGGRQPYFVDGLEITGSGGGGIFPSGTPFGYIIGDSGPCPDIPIGGVESCDCLPLDVSISGDVQFCPGETATLEAGGGFVDYLWSGNIPGQAITVGVGGQYCVTVTSVNGCTGSACMEVEESPGPAVALEGITMICEGETTVLTASGGTEYLWDTAENTAVIEVGAGTYCVTVTDAGGCTNEDCATVTETTSITPIFSQLGPYCVGQSPDALPAVSNNGISGSWNGGINTAFPHAETYIFTPDAGQCAEPASMAVDVLELQEPTFPPIGPFCQGESGFLPPISNEGFFGFWDGELDTSLPGTYNFVFYPDNAGDCVTEGFVTVVVLPGEFTPTFDQLGPYCENSPPVPLPTVSIEGIVGSWDHQNVFTSFPGIDTYTFFPEDGQCAFGATMDIEILPSLQPDISGNLNVCTGETTLLTASAGFASYEWSTGDAGEQVVVPAGTYCVTVTNPSGCLGSDCVEVEEVPCDCPLVQVQADAAAFCGGEMATLTGTIDDPNNTLDYFEWTDASGNVLGTSLELGVTEMPTGCSSYLGVYTLNAYCTDGTVSADDVIVYFFPLPEVNVEVYNDGCSIIVGTLCPDFEVVGANPVSTVAPDFGTVDFEVINEAALLAGAGGCSVTFSGTFACSELVCPEISGLSPSQTEACSGEFVTIASSIDDPDGNLDRYEWLDADGNIVFDGSELTISATTDACEPSVEQYTLNVYCTDDPTVPSASETATITFFPEYNPAFVTALPGGCNPPSIIVDCAEYVVTEIDVPAPGDIVPGESGTASWQVAGQCFDETVTANYNCAAGCPQLNAPVNESYEMCNDQAIDLAQYEALIDYTEPATFGGIAWYGDAAMTTLVDETADFVVDGCGPLLATVYPALLCTIDPAPIPAGQITFTIHRFADAADANIIWSGDGCELPVVEVPCPNFALVEVDVPAAINPGDSGTAEWQLEGFCNTVSVTHNFDCPALLDGCPVVTQSASGVLPVCSGGSPDFGSVVFDVEYDDPDGTFLQFEWYADASYTSAGIPGTYTHSGTDLCETEEVTVFLAISCASNPTPIPAGTATIVVYPPYDAGFVEVTSGDCGVAANVSVSCANYVAVPPASGVTVPQTGDSGFDNWTVAYSNLPAGFSCFDETVEAPYSCAGCPTLTSGLDAELAICDGDLPDLAGFEGLPVLDDPNGTFDAWAWYSNFGLTTPLDNSVFAHSSPGNCTVETRVVYLAYFCSQQPGVPIAAGSLEVGIYPEPSNIVVPVGECSLAVADDCGGLLAVEYFDNASGMWVNAPNGSPEDGETAQWRAYVPGAPDADLDGTPDCLQTGTVTASCDCVTPNPPVALQTGLTVCEGVANTTAFEVSADAGLLVQWFDQDGDLVYEGVDFVPVVPGSYEAQTLSADGCSSAPINAELVEIASDLSFEMIEFAAVCAGGGVELSSVVGGGDDLIWTAASGSFDNPQTPVVVFEPPATQSDTTVWVYLTASNQCETVVDSVPVDIIQYVHLAIEGETSVLAGESVVLTASGAGDGSAYAWLPEPSLSCTDCPDPLASPTETTTYSVTSEDICVVVAVHTVEVLDPPVAPQEDEPLLPNAFSPNGDGINDEFKPMFGGVGVLVQYRFMVYNRWGERVFAGSDPDVGWDGMYNGKLSEIGVYTFALEYATLDGGGETRLLKGNVTLIR